MRVAVITDQTETACLRSMDVQEGWHLRGPVDGCLGPSDTDRAKTIQRLGDQEDGGGALPFILLVIALGCPLFRWQRLPDLLAPLPWWFGQASQRALGLVRHMVDCHDRLHRRHTVPILRGWNAPPSGA